MTKSAILCSFFFIVLAAEQASDFDRDLTALISLEAQHSDERSVAEAISGEQKNLFNLQAYALNERLKKEEDLYADTAFLSSCSASAEADRRIQLHVESALRAIENYTLDHMLDNLDFFRDLGETSFLHIYNLDLDRVLTYDARQILHGKSLESFMNIPREQLEGLVPPAGGFYFLAPLKNASDPTLGVRLRRAYGKKVQLVHKGQKSNFIVSASYACGNDNRKQKGALI